MSRRTYVILSVVLILIVTAINYSMVDADNAASRSHGGTTIFLPGSGGTGWHK